MTNTGISGFATRVFTSTRLIAVAMVVAFTAVAMQPAQAQSSDTWKSVAIIGGSTAAGAYIGHRIAGSTGAYIGAGIGATAGYAIDRKRRQNEYSQYGYDPNASYDPNAGYDPNGGYYGNGPYGGGYDPAGYPGGLRYQGNNNSRTHYRQGYSQRRVR
jgi:hypothetical protein